MAKITTIINPLTGQPAQVDQLEHTAQQIDDAIARALPGGAIDIALQNNDPRNWGIGAESKGIASGDDLNNVWCGGLYSWGTGVSNAPFDYGLMVVLSPGAYANGRVQIAYDRVNKTIAIRWLNNTWSPWEYQNPPMEEGVEYRTTERHLGKPVYVMAINFGALPNKTAKYVDHGIKNIDNAISAGGTTSNGYTIPYHTDWDNIDVGANKGSIIVKTAEDQSGKTAVTWIAYTKTTD